MKSDTTPNQQEAHECTTSNNQPHGVAAQQHQQKLPFLEGYQVTAQAAWGTNQPIIHKLSRLQLTDHDDHTHDSNLTPGGVDMKSQAPLPPSTSKSRSCSNPACSKIEDPSAQK